jgi:hypothetical protein
VNIPETNNHPTGISAKPKYVALNGDVLRFRVLDGDLLVDRLYVRNTAVQEDFNCWTQMQDAREYARIYDQEMYESNWPPTKTAPDQP